MASGTADFKQGSSREEVEDFNEKGTAHHNADFIDQSILNDAYEGENREHQMGSWEAAKKHPMACLWAFLFCFTIVSQAPPFTHITVQLIRTRSWNPSICF